MNVPVDQADADQRDAPDRTEALAQLARILDSREFRAARNRARFLEYVVTRTLDGAGDTLKEYTVGVEVFDRGAAFDPRTDGVVRTQAGLVRKHLERYYAAEGRTDPVEIELPKGHYIPLVRWRASAADGAHEAAATTGALATNGAFATNGTGPDGPSPRAAGHGEHGGTGQHGGRPSDTDPGDAARPASRWWLRVGIAATLIAASALTAAILARGIRSGGAAPASSAAAPTTATAATSAADEAERRILWGPFLAPGAPNVLAFGIPQFFTAGSGIWIRDVEVNTPAAVTSAGRLATLGRHIGPEPLTPAEAYTGIGEAYGVYLLSRFFLGGARELRVVRSPTLGWDNLKHDNVIFLTSARFKTLADQLSYPSAFVHVVGTPNKVVNLHPLPGEQAEYPVQAAAPGGAPGTALDRPSGGADYAIVSMWPGKLPGRRVLVLSGSHTWGTQAAAEYVTETGYLRELNQHLLACQRRHGQPRHADFFQVLLKVEVRDNQPVGVRYVTHRDLALSETGEPTTAASAPTLNAQDDRPAARRR